MGYVPSKIIHLISLAVLFLSFGMILAATLQTNPGKLRKAGFILHGISWLTLFLSAFGLVSALGMHAAFPKWASVKTVIWVALGLSVLLLAKRPKLSGITMLLISGLGVAAIWLAVAKPAL
ncbi:hypothetical protein [Bdellovibrio bacteriovorus]|uniref:hypothetical protein n=2 Tax=Bdellovibrio TaxID=958 RepID=UPI0035A57B88